MAEDNLAKIMFAAASPTLVECTPASASSTTAVSLNARNSEEKCEDIYSIRYIKSGAEINISYDKGGPSHDAPIFEMYSAAISAAFHFPTLKSATCLVKHWAQLVRRGERHFWGREKILKRPLPVLRGHRDVIATMLLGVFDSAIALH